MPVYLMVSLIKIAFELTIKIYLMNLHFRLRSNAAVLKCLFLDVTEVYILEIRKFLYSDYFTLIRHLDTNVHILSI